MTKKVLLLPSLARRAPSTDIQSQQTALSDAGYNVAVVHDSSQARTILKNIHAHTPPAEYDAVVVAADSKTTPSKSPVLPPSADGGPVVIFLDSLLLPSMSEKRKQAELVDILRKQLTHSGAAKVRRPVLLPRARTHRRGFNAFVQMPGPGKRKAQEPMPAALDEDVKAVPDASQALQPSPPSHTRAPVRRKIDALQPLRRNATADSWNEPAHKALLRDITAAWDTHAAETGKEDMAVGDMAFRKLVKNHCGFPAYFGLVLHQRVVEYSNYASYLEACTQFLQEVVDKHQTYKATEDASSDSDFITTTTGSSDDTDMAPCPPSPPKEESLRSASAVVKPKLRQYFPQPQQFDLHPCLSLKLPRRLRSLLDKHFPANHDIASSPAPTPKDATSAVVSLEEFLHFWTPAIAAGDKVTKWLAVVTPPQVAPQFRDAQDHCKALCTALEKEANTTPDGATAADARFSVLDAFTKSRKQQGPGAMRNNVCGVHDRSQYPLQFPSPRVRMCDVRPLVEALIDRHPDLYAVRRDPVLREEYVTSVLTAVFSSLHGHCTGVITRAEIRESNLVEAFHTCATRSLNSLIPFSISHFREVKRAWDAVNAHGKGLVDMKDVLNSGHCGVAAYALQRIFSEVPRPFLSDEPGKMCFEDFMWFWLAQRDRMSETSLEYWFRVLDLNGSGRLEVLDLECAYEYRVEHLAEEGEIAAVSTADAMNQLYDVVLPRNPRAFSCLDIRRSNAGSVVFDLTLGLKGSAASRNYLMQPHPLLYHMLCGAH